MSDVRIPVPVVGMGATLSYVSDRYPATIIAVSKSGKSITLQEDTAIRTDSWGMSDMQSYEYSRNPEGATYIARLCKDGRWHVGGVKGQRVTLDVRSRYYDFSF